LGYKNGVDVLGLFAGGLIGTAVMTTMMEAGQALRLTRMSLPFILGTLVTENRMWAKVFGFFIHFVNGLVFALGYALLFEVLDRSDWWIGMVAGLGHGAVVLVAVLPLLEDVHHRMAAEDEGPDPTPMLQPPGFLALNYGVQTPVGTLVAHLVYGAIVAVFYRPLG
jgi:hypothetical protein